MFEARTKIAGGLLAAGLAAGCAAPPDGKEAAPINMPEFDRLHVACVDVSGFTPFPEETCAEEAANIQAGLNYFSQLTGGKIKPPQVTHQRYPADPIQIEDARTVRCLRLDGEAGNDNFPKADRFMETVVDEAVKRAGIDLNTTGIYVSVNAPVSLCREESDKKIAPITQTERCPSEAEAPRYYPGGRALYEVGPIIFGFTGLPSELMKEHMAHEYGHLGRGPVRLGHEHVLCNKEGDELPSVIRQDQTGLDVVQEMSRGGLMSYSEGGPAHIAVPQLAYLGVVSEAKVISPDAAGTFSLHEPTAQGLAAIQLPLSNLAITNLINDTGPSDGPKSDYRLWLGKSPGQPGVAVYAAPGLAAGKAGILPPPSVFPLDIIAPGQELTIEGDMRLSNVRAANDTSVTFNLQPL